MKSGMRLESAARRGRTQDVESGCRRGRWAEIVS